MTFSDAEDDQPSSLLNRDCATDNSSNQQSDDANEAGAVGGNEASAQSYQSSENSEPNISTDFLAAATFPLTNGLVPDANGNNNVIENEGCEVNDNQLVALQSEATERLEPSSSVGCSLDLPRFPIDVHQDAPNEASGCESLENVDLETEKINEKLLQIQGYILQTTNAMHALEGEGNMGPEEGMRSADQPKESGSESLGVVGLFNDGDGPLPSLHERLNHQQHEQEILSARLRESLVRRQELMTRYQATRERLNNLKRKRYGIAQDERQLLQSVGANETPYENPIPEADSWTIEQLESAVQDFIALREKVDRVHQAYLARLEAVEDGDTTTPIELHAKIEQVLNKRLQIVSALSQMREFLLVKRDGGAAVEENVGPNQFHPEENNYANQESQNSETAVVSITVNDEISRHVPSDDITPAQVSDEELFNRDITEGAQALSDEVLELQAKQNHLQSLKNQLNAMRLLLQVNRGAPSSLDNENDHSVFESIIHNGIDASPNLLVDLTLENNDDIVGDTIVGLKGSVIHLSESERRNPLVVSKYMQLNQAKERLARMEEVMKLISEAGEKGLPLDQVLSSEDMDILTQAREEEDLSLVSPVTNAEEHQLLDSVRNRETRSQDQQLQTEDKSNPQPKKQLSQAKERLARMEEVMKLISEAGEKGLSLDHVLSSEDMDILTQAQEEEDLSLVSPVTNLEEHQLLDIVRNRETRSQVQQLQKENKSNPQPKKNKVNEMKDRQTNDSTAEWEREREISAMHFHLNKKTPGIPSVNDGSRIEREKGALKKQAQNLFCEGGNDPRVNELFTLQEELKEKKNALEALMKKMGKSSSFTFDNFSDNISENISDCNSETLERPTASWGTGEGRFFTDLYQSEDDIIHVTNDEVPILNSISSVGIAANSHQATEDLPPSNFQQNGPQKNSNALNPSAPKTQINSGNPQFSVNNLNNPRSVRPKHNQPSAGGSHSVGVWENMNGVNSNVFQQNSNTKVQNTVSSALVQLSQVQDTINSLYEDLRIAERESRQSSIPFNQPVNTLGNNITGSPFPQPPPSSSTSTNVNANFHLPQPSYYNNQGRGEAGTTNHLIAGLQQCFSQLYLHSLEIQSLNKHLQVLDQKEKPSPSHRRDFHQDQRSERPHVVPFDGGQKHRSSAMQDFKPNFTLPSFHAYDDAKHEEFPHRSFPNQIDIADGVDSNATHLRQNEDSLLEVSNPLYDRIPNNRPSTWSVPSHAAGPSISNKNFFTPFNDRVPNDERRTKNDSYLSNSTDIPVDTDDIAENLPWAWQTESPHQVHNQQSTDILNNQVLPGTRANNYWDNFRSYSHQNPLSTAAKCNTGERHPTISSSTPGAQPLNSNSRMRSMGFENRQYNLTSGSNHSINKASDKNSSNTRSQNKGARSRYLHQTNSRRSTLSDSHLYNFVASPSSELQFRNDARKRNNQQNYGASNEQDFYNHGESSRSFGHITPDIDNREATERDRGFRSQRSRNIDDNRDPNGDQFSQFLNLERINRASQEDLTNTEAYSHVVREAESLMQKHSHQPQFLLQLFHHASQITSNTDQHVALELLKELSNQRHQSNISNNRWNSNSSVTQSENLSTGLSTTATGRNKYRNDARYPNKNSHIAHGISGSDSSEGGMSSEEDERERKENIGGQSHLMRMKNLAPNAAGNGPSPTNRSFPQNYDSPAKTLSRMSVAPQLSLVPHNIMPLAATSKVVTGKDSANIACDIASHEKCKSENQSYVQRFHKMKSDSDNTVRNFQPNYCREVSPSFLQNSYELISHVTEEDISTHHGSLNFSRKRKSPRRDVSADGKNNFALKNRQKNFNFKHPDVSQPIQQGPAGFESIVSAALREVLRVFEWPENNISSNVQVLETLHQSIMTQVELQSKSLGISSSFVASVESQLRATLQGFQGKRISHVRQELAATITQVLIHQYCSLLVTQENSSDYIQPQTPDSNYTEFQSISNNTEADESFSSAASRHLNNQPCLNSLISQPEGVVKQQKHHKPLWSYNPNIIGEFIQMNREEKMQLNKGTIAQGRDETKPNPINLSRGRGGAISKTSACSNLPINNDNFITRSNVMGGSSPTSDSSYLDASWIVSRGAASSIHAEGNLNSSSHDSYSCAQRGRNGRESVDASEMLDLEQNDTEADQGDHARSKEFHNSLLPVHDLAEADQSQDVLDVECDSSVEDENQNAAVGAFSQPSQHQTQDSPVRLVTRKNLGPTSGLDEVPTRLLSGPDGASPPLGSSIINGRHPPEGLASSSETRNRPGSHNLGINTAQFLPPQNSSSPQHQFDGRHPPDGQNQVGQQQPAFHPSDSTGNAG